MPNTSPFASVTQAAGAVVASVADWELPLHFANPPAEYEAVLQSAALFDCSHHGKLEVTGPEAPSFLNGLSSNDVAGLPLGGGCRTFFLNPKARVLFDVAVYHVRIDGGRDALWLDVTPGYHEKLLQHLDRYLISEQVELADRTHQFGQLHLAGPQAKAVLEKVLGEPLPDLAHYLHMERTIGQSATVHIRRRDHLGVLGYDIVCLNERAEGVWRMLASAGATPAGLQAFELRRIEAGTPVYGIDIDENRFVMEVGDALSGVCYTKGCFIGQEPIVMARDRAGKINRAFLGVKLDGTDPLPARTTLYNGDEEVGLVTSSVVSPSAGPIALAYLRLGHQTPGLRLTARLDEGERHATVTPLPLR